MAKYSVEQRIIILHYGTDLHNIRQETSGACVIFASVI